MPELCPVRTKFHVTSPSVGEGKRLVTSGVPGGSLLCFRVHECGCSLASGLCASLCASCAGTKRLGHVCLVISTPRTFLSNTAASFGVQETSRSLLLLHEGP